jgi:DNA-binding response OmpR family regulator
MATRILVVNDTQDILEMFRLLLEYEGYEVILSSIPMQQMSDVEQLHPDLIILDLVFGNEKTGMQMLQLLKMHRATAGVPVIVCTAALQMVREMEGYLVSKNVLVIYKPFDVDELLKTVKQALETHASSLPAMLDKQQESPATDD